MYGMGTAEIGYKGWPMEYVTIAWPDGMWHRTWRETKQQLILLPDLALLGYCLVSLHFRATSCARER